MSCAACRQAAKRTRQQQIVVALDHRQRRLQLMGRPTPGTPSSVRSLPALSRRLAGDRVVSTSANLLPPLKLQEVNRQKTVFLASAAHELKTRWRDQGYYDLLLAGSLGA